MNLLNFVISVPALAALAMLAGPPNSRLVRRVALALSILICALAFMLLPTVLSAPEQYHFETDVTWIRTPEVHYHVGIDGMSVWIIVLTSLLGVLATLISWRHIHGNLRKFYAWLFLLQFGVFGALSALDLFLFYVFWEVIMVPMAFLLGVWGRERRVQAAVKYFLYAMGASLFMLASILYISVKAGTFDSLELMAMLGDGRLRFSTGEELLLFLGFMIAFAAKVPLFPLHGWMPDVHGESAAGGPVDIAATMAKLGPYAILRFAIPLFPGAAQTCAPHIVKVAIFGIVLFGLVALAQANMKRLVAYSSIGHMSFVTLGIFSLNSMGIQGAVYLLLAHAVSSSALFMLIGFLYDRRRSTMIADYGGAAASAPRLATVFMGAMLAAIGLPFLGNFVGEFLILQGAATVNFRWAIAAAIGAVLSACYMLWLYQRSFFGPVHVVPEESKRVHHAPHFAPEDMHDLRRREWMAIAPLLVLMVALGLGSQAVLPSISAATTKVLRRTGATASVPTPQAVVVAPPR